MLVLRERSLLTRQLPLLLSDVSPAGCAGPSMGEHTRVSRKICREQDFGYFWLPVPEAMLKKAVPSSHQEKVRRGRESHEAQKAVVALESSVPLLLPPRSPAQGGSSSLAWNEHSENRGVLSASTSCFYHRTVAYSVYHLDMLTRFLPTVP